MIEYLNTSLDASFGKIDTLKWLPFVGKDYMGQSFKTLIVGESHYVPEDESPEMYLDKNWTRNFILKEGLQLKPWNYSSTKNNLVREIEKTLTGGLSNESWNNWCYFNLIQRLIPSIGVRPNYDDIKYGLLNFKNTVGLLGPDRIVFCGTEASKHFQNLLNDESFQIVKYKFGETKINGAYPKSFDLSINKKKIKCFFIKHPSMAFSAVKWREFIENV